MTYAEFKSDHDYLVTELIFTNNEDKIERLLEHLKILKDNEPKHFDRLWAEL